MKEESDVAFTTADMTNAYCERLIEMLVSRGGRRETSFFPPLVAIKAIRRKKIVETSASDIEGEETERENCSFGKFFFFCSVIGVIKKSFFFLSTPEVPSQTTVQTPSFTLQLIDLQTISAAAGRIRQGGEMQ